MILIMIMINQFTNWEALRKWTSQRNAYEYTHTFESISHSTRSALDIFNTLRVLSISAFWLARHYLEYMNNLRFNITFQISDYDYLQHTAFRIYFINYQLNTNSPPQFWGFFFFFFFFFFFLPSNHLALLQDRYLKKMLLKRARIRRLFSQKIGSNDSVILYQKQFQAIRIAYLEFKVWIHYGLWEKKTLSSDAKVIMNCLF